MKAEEYEQLKKHVSDQIKTIRTEELDPEKLAALFENMFDYVNGSFQTIESRIQQELSPKMSHVITSGIMDAAEYQLCEGEIFPMISGDEREHKISLSDLRKGMKAGEPVKLFTVFLEADHSLNREFQRTGRLFPCNIISDEWNYKGHCFLKPRTDYLEKMEWLFRVFQRNGEEFPYPFVPYLDRFYDVYLKDAEFYDIESLRMIKVDWGEFEEYVRYELFPVWNVTKKRLEAEVKPIPSEYNQQFCNLINFNRLRKDCTYLAAEEREVTLETNPNGDLSIISDLENKKNWQMAEFHPALRKEVQHPMFSSSKVPRLRIVTKSDVFAFVKELGFSDLYPLKQVEIKKQTDYAKVTFDIHSYVKDRLPQEKTVKQLWLYFAKNGAPCFYDSDVLSYLISMVQIECRQYDCVGRFL